MSSGDEAPAIKLYNNKKEQEMYENFAGELMECNPCKLKSPRICAVAAHTVCVSRLFAALELLLMVQWWPAQTFSQ